MSVVDANALDNAAFVARYRELFGARRGWSNAPHSGARSTMYIAG